MISLIILWHFVLYLLASRLKKSTLDFVRDKVTFIVSSCKTSGQEEAKIFYFS